MRFLAAKEKLDAIAEMLSISYEMKEKDQINFNTGTIIRASAGESDKVVQLNQAGDAEESPGNP
jgi:hypothetical protein